MKTKKQHDNTSGGGEVPVVLFDLDGTLIATKRLYLECYRRALEAQLGTRVTDADILARKPRAELRFLPEQVDADGAEPCMEVFYEQYRALHGELFEGVYTGVPELLAELRSTGVPLGIVTGKSRRGWEITAEHVDLGPFDVLVFDDDVSAPKPDPDGILRALDALGAPPHRAAYVGDAIGDVRAARAAGVQPFAVLWSKKPEERDSFAAKAREEGAVVLAEPAELASRLPCRAQ